MKYMVLLSIVLVITACGNLYQTHERKKNPDINKVQAAGLT
jgi:hypothetical protein